MSKNNALFLAAIIFDFVALAHLIRVILKMDIVIDTYPLPIWTSIVGFIVAFVLSLIMLLSRSKSV